MWPFSNDAGCVLYGIPARREWYQDSYAHNTLVVNQQSQTTFSQAIHQANGSEICLKAVDAFPNVSVTRKVAIHAGALVDVLTASAESEQLYDFVFHVDGSLTVEAASVEPMDERAGSSVAAQQIELTKKIAGVDSAEFTILYNNQTFALVLAGNEPFDVLIGTAPGTSWDPTQRRHVIIGRTQAKTQQYQTTIKHIS